MDLAKEKIDRYNKIIREKHGKNATEDEILEIDGTINTLFEIIYELYLNHKKSGKLPEIMKIIESDKLTNYCMFK